MKLAIGGRIVRSESFRAAAILIGVLHVCFIPCIWGSKTLLSSSKDCPSIMPAGAWAGPPAPFHFSRMVDSGSPALFSEPNLPLLRYQYFHERVAPLWNPYQAYGAPLAADQQSQAFYPLTLALLVHLGPRTYNWFLLARLFLAGICSYLYLRFFVSFWPGIAGGVTSMLAGYYVVYLAMPHLSVEVLIPGSLLAGEVLLRKRNYWPVAAFAIMLLLVFLGGMPESALLLLALLYSYILFRIVSNSTLRASWLTAMARLMAATCSGLALSAFYLLPFRELMHRSFDLHQPRNLGGILASGLYHDGPRLSIFTYFFPLLYGPPGSPFGIANYVGLLSFFLLAIAVAAVFGKKHRNDGPLKAITWFFFGFATLLVLKRYGLAVNAIGALPLFRMVFMVKYEEALLSICVSMLAAIGVERLMRRELSARVQAIALGLTALLIPAALWFSRQTLRNEILQLHLPRRFAVTALAVPALLTIGVGVMLVFSWRRRATAGLDVRLAIGIVALISVELWANFIGPTHYWFNRLPPLTHNPYLGAPYIDAIKKVAGNYRVFARDSILYPNWASAFQLYDIRELNAMYERKYLPFVRNFFQDQKDIASRSGPYDRFTGAENLDLSAPLAKRLLQLSSVKYIAGLKAVAVPNRMVDEVLEQNQGHLIPGKERYIGRNDFVLAGEARAALGEHPPYERMPYRIQVGNRPKEIFCFSIALNPAVFDKTAGDGVEFIVETKDSSGRITKQFSQYIDPKHNVQERRWMDGQVDLSTYRGQTIQLLFTTTPGPKDDTSYDWAAWSNFHFQGEEAAVEGPAPAFKLIYAGEANVYRYDDVLPRAAIYHHAEAAPNEAGALRKLADPSLDIFQSVVLNEAALNTEQRAQVAEINRQAPARVQAASIESYRSQDVQIEASLDRSGILVLNDTDYPGWTVDVDGHPAECINANYLFRGVLLPPGKHAVRFVYRPESFYLGAEISGATMVGLLLVGLARLSWRRGHRLAKIERVSSRSVPIV